MMGDEHYDSSAMCSESCDEIEITPPMIEVGVQVLWESGALETQMDDFDRELVRKIFFAMFRALKYHS